MQQISRKDLFEAAWSRPMTAIAAEFGITSTALKKTCERHKIPTPPRGHWAKVAAGRVLPTPALPPVSDSRLEQIRIVGGLEVPAVAREAQSAAKAKLAQLEPDFANVESAVTVREPAVVMALRKAISRARPDAEGFLHVSGKGLVPLDIGEACVERALNWLSRLISLAESQGHSLESKGDGAAFIVDGQRIPFRIVEKPARTPHVPTPKELAEKARRADWGYSASWTPWPKYDRSPSGLLSIELEANSYSGLRRTFADGKTQSLETMTSEILSAFAAHAALMTDNRRKAEESRRRAELAEARRQRRQAFETRETRRMQFVEAVSQALNDRTKLHAVLEHLTSTQSDGERGPDCLEEWLRRRIFQLDALLSPQSLDLSARSSKVDFDEVRALAAVSEPSWYYPRPVELQLWFVDPETGNAEAQWPSEWARLNGLLPHDEIGDEAVS